MILLAMHATVLLAAPTSTSPKVPSSWLSSPLVTGTLGLAALVTAVAILWKPVRGAVRLGRAVTQFVEDWTGREARTDPVTGAVIEPERRGVLAQLDAVHTQLETVRHQVENSHKTNLRDDVDRVEDKLDEHIDIAKDSDRQQAETAAKVERLYARWAASADLPDDH